MILYILAALTFWILSVFLVRRWIPYRFALPILGVKFSIPVIYRFLSGSIIPEYNAIAVDSFYSQTRHILDSGYTPISLLVDGFGPIGSIMGTRDPFYWWWNGLWITVIEDSLFTPVLANVFVMVLASIVATTLFARLDFPFKYQQLFLVFTIFHWEIVVWSSIMNIKDPLVALGTVSSIYLIVAGIESRNNRSLMLILSLLALILLITSYIRWYIPFLLFGTLCVWLIIEVLIRWESRPSALSIIFSVIIIIVGGQYLVNNFVQQISISHFPLGFFRYTVGPVPWGVATSYAFLTPAAILHWLLFPAGIVGALLLINNQYARLILIYVILMSISYAFSPDASGPRFRLQITLLYSVFQFYGVLELISRKYEIKLRK